MRPAVVLLTHGSRDPRWRQPMELLRDRLAAAGLVVELAFLQLVQPDLASALRACAARGAAETLVVPVFISGGGHLLRDVPRAVERAAAEVRGLSVRTTDALGEQPEVLDAMVRACARLAGER